MNDYLHNHKDFAALLRIVGNELNIEPILVEKDYWIMHVLYGLKQLNFNFELKGGTSLSKGYKIINRFSEDIDIHIKPPAEFGINENPKNTKPKNVEARKQFYDWLADTVKINGIVEVKRDTEFDDETYYRSGGIRLYYQTFTEANEGIKEGILLEAGFDKVTPNNALTISSWAYDKAIKQGVPVIDNRALDIACYHPGYTFVEKLQTVATKFRQEQETNEERQNLMRQYYDIYSLLGNDEVKNFIGTEEYFEHKTERFPKVDFDIPIAENEAFLLNNKELRDRFIQRYKATATLYYNGQPDFEEMLTEISKWVEKL
ncbi:nucleotidyl transferase AbiEii/AbiGii toxin family protein [Flavobacterium sp. LB3P21]|uniref:nucleotidyl transferase AbiEii/AbiGii toxin family protein n=1 Tax=Flavobacterium sp. LB3P21 TaxID=3401719 RepID=UPI003AAF8459